MPKVEIRREIVQRVTARRGRLHLYDALDPKRSALVVIDMQNAFVAAGAPMEVPGARGIVAPQYADYRSIAVARLIEREYYGFTPPPGYD